MGVKDQISNLVRELRKQELEDSRSLVLVPAGNKEDAARRELLETWLQIELGGSGSLNARGTTLAALAGATIALVANAGAAWLDQKWGLSTGVKSWLLALLGMGLLGLGLSVVCAIRAVWPNSPWRPELGELLERAGLSGFRDTDGEATLLLRILELQRAKNETKARRMRWAYLWLVAGSLGVISAASLFGIAVS